MQLINQENARTLNLPDYNPTYGLNIFQLKSENNEKIPIPERRGND